jgi:hypothetical protein
VQARKQHALQQFSVKNHSERYTTTGKHEMEEVAHRRGIDRRANDRSKERGARARREEEEGGRRGDTAAWTRLCCRCLLSLSSPPRDMSPARPTPRLIAEACLGKDIGRDERSVAPGLACHVCASGLVWGGTWGLQRDARRRRVERVLSVSGPQPDQ